MPLQSFDFKLPANTLKPAPGRLLVAQPFLFEPVFARTVILICEHTETGTLGYILNHPLPASTVDLFPQIQHPVRPIFHGGPVGEDQIQILHGCAELGGEPVAEGIFLGASLSDVESGIGIGTVDADRVRLFLGYSGWSEGQLEREIKEHAWYVVEADENLIFGCPPTSMWKTVVRSLGRGFAFFNNVPVDPQLN
jgi:putative transcriptional regulator